MKPHGLTLRELTWMAMGKGKYTGMMFGGGGDSGPGPRMPHSEADFAKMTC